MASSVDSAAVDPFLREALENPRHRLTGSLPLPPPTFCLICSRFLLACCSGGIVGFFWVSILLDFGRFVVLIRREGVQFGGLGTKSLNFVGFFF